MLKDHYLIMKMDAFLKNVDNEIYIKGKLFENYEISFNYAVALKH